MMSRGVGARGYHGNPITVMEAKITRSREIRDFFASLDTNDVRKLLDTLELRVDEESMFFLRLDKQEAYQGRIVLGRGDDVISVRGKVKSYPQSRENAINAMRDFLSNELERRSRKG